MWHYVTTKAGLLFWAIVARESLHIYTACSYHMVISFLQKWDGCWLMWKAIKATVVGYTCYLSVSLCVYPDHKQQRWSQAVLYKITQTYAIALPCSGACFWGTVWDGGGGITTTSKVLVHTGFSGGSMCSYHWMDHSLQYMILYISRLNTSHIDIIYTSSCWLD